MATQPNIRKTTAQYRKELRAKGISLIPIQKYIARHIHIKHRCMNGHTTSIAPGNVLSFSHNKCCKRCTYPTVKERLEKKRQVTKGGCWEWTGAVDSNGYGYMSNRNKDGQDKKVWVHRASYRFYKGHIGKKLVCHTCDNPPCFNPKHLFLGTHLDNVQDAVAKGRFDGRSGERRLSKIRQVKKMLKHGKPHASITKQIKISRGMVTQIAKRMGHVV